MTEEILTEFTMPFVRRSGEYEIKFIKAAYEEGGRAEVFMEIEQVRRGHLQTQFELCGARQVLIHSFPLNDPNSLAGKFLGRVIQRGEALGKMSYQRGHTNGVFPVHDHNRDENVIYEELKSLQKTQNVTSTTVDEDDEVS